MVWVWGRLYLRLSCKILIRLSAVTRLDPAVRTSFVDARRHSTVSFTETFVNVHGINASSPSLITSLWSPVWVWFERTYILYSPRIVYPTFTVRLAVYSTKRKSIPARCLLMSVLVWVCLSVCLDKTWWAHLLQSVQYGAVYGKVDGRRRLGGGRSLEICRGSGYVCRRWCRKWNL